MSTSGWEEAERVDLRAVASILLSSSYLVTCWGLCFEFSLSQASSFHQILFGAGMCHWEFSLLTGFHGMGLWVFAVAWKSAVVSRDGVSYPPDPIPPNSVD
jgi:hypothetical protein